MQKTGKSEAADFRHRQKNNKTSLGFRLRKCFKIHSDERTTCICLWNPLSFFPFCRYDGKKMSKLTRSSLSTSYILHLLWRVYFIRNGMIIQCFGCVRLWGCSPDVWCSLRAYVWTAGRGESWCDTVKCYSAINCNEVFHSLDKRLNAKQP